MIDANQIREHMEVKGSDGMHIGTVDHMEDGRIKLTKSDPAAGGMHHYIDMGMVKEIKDGAICLNKSAQECKQTWH